VVRFFMFTSDWGGGGTSEPVKFILGSYIFSGSHADAVSLSGHLRNTYPKLHVYNNMPGTKFCIYRLQFLVMLMQRGAGIAQSV
jgi:hypothetical protein